MEKAIVLKLLTSWETDQGRAMARAERHLRHPPKHHPWSPSLRNTAVIRKYWKLCLREIKERHNYKETFMPWELKIQQHDPSSSFQSLNAHLSIEEVRKHFNTATKHFRKAQMNSTDLRIKTYEDLIRTYMEDNNPFTQKIPNVKQRPCYKLSALKHVVPFWRSSLVVQVSHAIRSF